MNGGIEVENEKKQFCPFKNYDCVQCDAEEDWGEVLEEMGIIDCPAEIWRKCQNTKDRKAIWDEIFGSMDTLVNETIEKAEENECEPKKKKMAKKSVCKAKRKLTSQVVIINGSGGCGKDEFIKQCDKIVKCGNVDSVGYVKDVCKQYFGWNGEKTEEARLMLSNVKKLLKDHGDYPFKQVMNDVEALKVNTDCELIFIHIREPEEIERVKNELNAITILVDNPNVPKIETNDSDANVNDYSYDFYVHNDGNIFNLLEYAKFFVNEIDKIKNGENIAFWRDCAEDYKCSKCNSEFDCKYNYCPECGKRMLNKK